MSSAAETREWWGCISSWGHTMGRRSRRAGSGWMFAAMNLQLI
jgi:hypothetical protein